MTASPIEHAQFTLERTYPVPVDRAFRAWSDPELKKRWFVFSDGDDWAALDYGLDFRVGGREHGRFQYKGATVHGSETVYLDIVPDRRIAFAYTMSLDGKTTSASLGTVLFTPSGQGTRLTYTEQGAFFDGLDKPDMRQTGWGWLLDALGQVLEARA